MPNSTVTIAQALASSQSGLLVADTGSDIAAALPNPGLVARVTSFTLSAPSSVTAAQAEALAGLGAKFHLGGEPLMVHDTVGNLAASANAAGVALATSRAVVDTVPNLLAEPGQPVIVHATSVTMTGTATVHYWQLASLEGMPHFSVGLGSSLTISDTLTNIASALTAHYAWFTTLAGIGVTLDGSTVNATIATDLATLNSHGKVLTITPTVSDTVLHIADTAHTLATDVASLNALATHVPLAISLTNDGSPVSAADAAALAGLSGFSPAAHTLYVSDSAANVQAHATLFGHGYAAIDITSGAFTGTASQLLDPTLHLSGGATAILGTSATVTGAQGTALAALAGFARGTGVSVAASDTLAGLVANGAAIRTVATSVAATDSETLSAAGANTLGGIATAFGGAFSLAGHTVSVSDTAPALLGLSAGAASLASAVSLSADAVVSVAQLATLAALPNFTTGGHAIAVTDSAANLLALPVGEQALVSTTVLFGNATVSAAQEATLSALPGFSTGGHALTVSDTAQNLLALTAPQQLQATVLALSASQQVSAATLTALAGLGIKFDTAGHALTVADSAANLVSLAAPAIALASTELVNASATVSAATANTLAALPAVSLGAGVLLGVQDSIANLLGLAAASQALATSETLPGGTVATITAATGAALAALPHFSASGATLTVADTVAKLEASGTASWSGVAASWQVVDTAAALVAHAADALVLGASLVTLSGAATISGADATTLSGIAHFSAGGAALTVMDGPAAIAANEAAIAAIATTAEVSSAGPVDAAQAEALAPLSTAGKLVFLGGDQLAVVDSFANLTSAGNAGGLALAAQITVVDTPANLIAATGHDWGSRSPYYTLAADSTATGAQATALAAVGAHFSTGGHTLVMADDAANVVADAASLTTLGIQAGVTDTAANIAAQAGSLAGLGAALLSVTTTDTLAVSAATAAGLAPLAAKLTGAVLPVADSAANVDAHVAALEALGAHVAVDVTGSAAAVDAVAADLAGLGSALTVTLTDSAPVSAAIAAGVAPLGARLAVGTVLAVSDTGAGVAAQAASLHTLGASLGTVTLTDGDTVAAATAAALTPLDAHLGLGITLSVSDTAAAIATNTAAITTLAADLRLGTVTVAGDTVANVLANAAALASVGALVQIDDTAAHVTASLDALQTLAGLQGITLTDGGTPALTVAVATLGDDWGALTKIDSPHTLAVSDTAAAISVDLASGASALLAHRTALATITVSDAGAVTLTETQARVAGVDDGAGSVLSKLSGGSFDVTNVLAADVGLVAALPVAPGAISVSDTASAIAADLSSGASTIVANRGLVTAINVTNGVVTLAESVATAANVASGAGSALSKLVGAGFDVTGVTVAEIPNVAGLTVTPTAMQVSDTAANIEADLAGASQLVASRALITAIAVSDAGTVTLTEAQALAAHVDDGAGSVLAKLSGGGFAVTGVAIADIGTVATLPVAPSSLAVSDSTANISSDLASGSSAILAHLSLISAITASGGSVTLTEAQLLAAGVDAGGASAMAKLTGATLSVTNAAANLTPLFGGSLAVAPTSVSISDSAANIAASITAAGSLLVADRTAVSAITVSDGQPVTLTEAQVRATGVDDGAGSVLSKLSGGTLTVTGVLVADINTVAGLAVAPSHILVADTGAAILADLTGGSSQIAAQHLLIAGVAATDATLDIATAVSIAGDLPVGVAFLETGLVLTGSAAEILSAETSSAGLVSAAAGVELTGNPTGLTAAQATTLAGLVRPLAGGQTLEVSDTLANLLNSANAAGLAFATTVDLSTVATTDAATATGLAALHGFDTGVGAASLTVSDTAANLLTAANAAGLAVASAVTLSADATVSASQLAGLAAIAHFGTAGHALALHDGAAAIAGLAAPALALASTVAVSDTAANVTAELDALQSALSGHLSITLTDPAASGPSISVSAATYAADHATLDAITNAGAIAVTGLAADIAALSSSLAADAGVVSVAVADTSSAVLSNLPTLQSIGGKLSVTISDTEVLAASAVQQLLTIPNLTATNVSISDTGAQLAAVIEGGTAGAAAFMNTHAVSLSADSVVGANDALALESLTALEKNGHALKVWDTASHLTDAVDGYLAAVGNTLIDGVYLKTTGGSATLTASTAATLLAIPNFSKNNPDGTTNTVSVADSAAHIDANFAALQTRIASLNGIAVNASATITDATLGDLLTLGATLTGGAALTVRDTAATILADAPAQLAGSPSLAPAAWMLSGSASVTEANAAYLAGLTGFSAGAYTLTLSASAAITVADANAIATLGNAFSLGGHTLSVAGSVASLAALTAGAEAIATPALSDSFANITALSANSPLLAGTVTVTDSETVTAANAAAFLALIGPGGGSGIPAADVNFAGHVMTIADTVANLQSLTASAGWTGNPSLHADFTLNAADSVANLIDTGNRGFLSGLAATTLTGYQIATAAAAETLATIATDIHFTLGGQSLMVSDTAAHLLDPANADGLALATILALAGPDSVGAAGAETLLSNAKFDPIQVLTITDSAANLLDGVLAGEITASPYAADIRVELSAPATLDAQTAEALVSMPEFINNNDLTIADSSTYLLNPANQAAELRAVSVTLAGDETVSANTILRLSELPNFTPGTSHLILAGNDYADAATLKAVADLGSAYEANGHSLTLTQDQISLTPTEYAAAEAASLVTNGHLVSAMPVGVSVVATAGEMTLSATGVAGATGTIYDASGTLITTSAEATSAFSIAAADGAGGHDFSVTETVGGVQSAPIVVLEQASLESAVSGAGASFATSGTIAVDAGKYLNLYTAGSVPTLTAPALVYDPVAHTISLDIPGQAATTLITLGAATHPTSLLASEIFVKHYA